MTSLGASSGLAGTASLTYRLPAPVGVTVLDRGRWRPGCLRKWRHRDGRWQGHVLYFDSHGVFHLRWRDMPLLRSVEGTLEATFPRALPPGYPAEAHAWRVDGPG